MLLTVICSLYFIMKTPIFYMFPEFATFAARFSPRPQKKRARIRIHYQKDSGIAPVTLAVSLRLCYTRRRQRELCRPTRGSC